MSNEQNSEIRIDETRDAIKKNYGDSADGQHYNDRSELDFDPADGLYSGTALDGTTEIAGPHASDRQDEDDRDS